MLTVALLAAVMSRKHKVPHISLADIHHEKDVCLSKQSSQKLNGGFAYYYPLNFYIGHTTTTTCTRLSAALAPKVLLPTTNPPGDNKLGCNKGDGWHQPKYQQPPQPKELETKQPGGRVIMFKYERHDGCGEGTKHQLFLWALAHQTDQVYGGMLPSSGFHTDHSCNCDCMLKFVALPENLHDRITGYSVKDHLNFETDCTGKLPEGPGWQGVNKREWGHLEVCCSLFFYSSSSLMHSIPFSTSNTARNLHIQ
jgi:hypothetical protein